MALKVLPQDVAATEERKERFAREARAISQLNHPHICTLDDIGEHDGTDYLVMEHLEGETLTEVLKPGARSLDVSLEYAVQMADALDKAHRAGIVHRDLGPELERVNSRGIRGGTLWVVRPGGGWQQSETRLHSSDYFDVPTSTSSLARRAQPPRASEALSRFVISFERDPNYVSIAPARSAPC